MNHTLQPYRSGNADGAVSVGERNRVLRNTYWLLALSMVPTVLGAWIGVSTGAASALSPGIGLVVLMAGAFGEWPRAHGVMWRCHSECGRS